MEILFVASDKIPHVGGKSSHILDLKDGLKKNGIKSEIISLSSLSRLRNIHIKLMLFPVKILNTKIFSHCFRYVSGKQINKKVYKYCKNNSVDCISVQDASAAYLIRDTVKKLNIPIVMTMHTYFGIENSLDIKMTKFDQIAYQKSLSTELSSLDVVNGVIAVDNRIRKHVEDVICKNNKNIKYVTSIENFTNVDKYNICSKAEKCNARKKLNIPKEKFVVCCVRRLVEKNGVIELVKAMNIINDNNIVLFIAGDGPQKELIEEYIKEKSIQNKVHLVGSLKDDAVRDIYNASDISVVPSITVNGLQEATSISAIESMACGLPTIASNIGGLSQLIKNDYTGILVEERNPNQIAEAILKLKLDNKYYNNIRFNARKFIENNHSHTEVAKRYLEAFKKCLYSKI